MYWFISINNIHATHCLTLKKKLIYMMQVEVTVEAFFVFEIEGQIITFSNQSRVPACSIGQGRGGIFADFDHQFQSLTILLFPEGAGAGLE